MALQVLMVTLCTHIMIFWGMNSKLLQIIYFLKNAKETCKPNNCNLSSGWKKTFTWIIKIANTNSQHQALFGDYQLSLNWYPKRDFTKHSII